MKITFNNDRCTCAYETLTFDLASNTFQFYSYDHDKGEAGFSSDDQIYTIDGTYVLSADKKSAELTATKTNVLSDTYNSLNVPSLKLPSTHVTFGDSIEKAKQLTFAYIIYKC